MSMLLNGSVKDDWNSSATGATMINKPNTIAPARFSMQRCFCNLTSSPLNSLGAEVKSMRGAFFLLCMRRLAFIMPQPTAIVKQTAPTIIKCPPPIKIKMTCAISFIPLIAPMLIKVATVATSVGKHGIAVMATMRAALTGLFLLCTARATETSDAAIAPKIPARMYA